ncbi:MAG: hypothetical protein HN879_05835 [Flavobacteriaceae bacterium]|jgi:hypothetical protein|nr:hypothetical protein [Flavobacteriaceae bacterium]
MSATDLSKEMPANLNGGAARNWLNIRVKTLKKSNVANKDQLIADFTAYRHTQFPEVVAVGPPAAPPKKASQNAVGPPAAPSKKASKKAVGPPASSPTSEISVAQLQQQIIDLQQKLAPKNTGGGNSSTPVVKKKICTHFNGKLGSCHHGDNCWFIHDCPPSAQPSGPPSGGGGKAAKVKVCPVEEWRVDLERTAKVVYQNLLTDLKSKKEDDGGQDKYPETIGDLYERNTGKSVKVCDKPTGCTKGPLCPFSHQTPP